MKLIIILFVVMVGLMSVVYITDKPKTPAVVTDETVATSTDTTEVEGNIEDQRRVKPEAGTPIPTEGENPPIPIGKLKADTFVGTLQTVNTGCFADGECFVEVDGKHVTAIMGWSQDTVGKIVGVEGFGDLEKYIGKKVEVYAQDKSDGTYTLYGSEGFYIKVLE